jgi:hypothetical protein
MKGFFLELYNKFMKYRDILIIVLVGVGVFFFVQKGQAVKQLSPDQLWQDKWKEMVPPPQPVGDGTEGETKVNPLNAPSHASDIFKQIPIKAIEPISSNPIWTPANEYDQLRQRLEALKKDYQDAIAAGDPKTSREKLVQYCKDDPKGRIIKDWQTPPQTLLTNLVCEQTNQNLVVAMESARTAGQAATSGDQTNLMKAMEDLGQGYTNLKKAVDEATANPDCASQSQGAEGRLSEAQNLLASLGESRENLNQKLLRQEYDSLMADGGGIDTNSDPSAVAGVLERIRKFRDLYKQLDPNNTILDQARLDRLQEVQTKVESGKDTRITQVRQNIQGLAGTEKLQENRQVLEQILAQFDTLEKLGDPKATADKREYDGYIQKLEAIAIVQEINGLLATGEKEMESLKAQLEAKQDTTEAVKKVTEVVDKVEELRKKPSVRRAPGGPEVNKRWTTFSSEWKRIRQKLRQE